MDKKATKKNEKAKREGNCEAHREKRRCAEVRRHTDPEVKRK